jgi:Ni2+-binding GTPase involved in maturation of urease and hydrogenase
MKPSYIMIGGFLGAGKTTALLRLAEHLTAQGRRVGLITNDQSSGLVDTALVDSRGYPVQEITGGCFCCRFNSLTAAAEHLTETAKPDVFLAEPVGSCTDLRASVQYPLRRLYGDDYRVAPLSVLVDPIRALRVLNLEPGPVFSPKVLYVYGKQLEEADIIVINKGDLLTPERRSLLEEGLRKAYPKAEVFIVSARSGEGMDSWFHSVVTAECDARPAPHVDYDTYAEGEALLGWFNGTFNVTGSAPFDGNLYLMSLAREIRERLGSDRLEIAHFKTVLTPDENAGDIGALNLVGSDREPEWTHSLHDELTSGELIVNLRAEGSPDVLRHALVEALGAVCAREGAQFEVVHMEHFRPPRPVPTYRMAVGAVEP